MKLLGKVRDRSVRASEPFQNAASGGIRERGERSVEDRFRILNHMVQYIAWIVDTQGGCFLLLVLDYAQPGNSPDFFNSIARVHTDADRNGYDHGDREGPVFPQHAGCIAQILQDCLSHLEEGRWSHIKAHCIDDYCRSSSSILWDSVAMSLSIRIFSRCSERNPPNACCHAGLVFSTTVVLSSAALAACPNPHS